MKYQRFLGTRQVCCAILLAFVTWSMVAGEQTSPGASEVIETPSDAAAQYRLARQYSRRESPVYDLKKAAQLLRASAEQGYAASQTDLAAAYANGSGVAQDFSQAVQWYRRAAEQGDVVAQYTLGRICLEGRGVEKSPSEAQKWLERAADQGKAEAYLVLGDLFLNRAEVVKPDFEKAFRYFSKAFELGNVSALNSLGFLFEHGSGVPLNPQRAWQCYHDAAEAGDPRGQMNLGRLLLEGPGVEKDPVEAYKWFKLALRNGELVARHYLFEMDTHGELTESQMAEGETRVQKFLKAHKKNGIGSSGTNAVVSLQN